MSVRDALLLNLTGSNFEALQSNDTARIKGDLSFEKDNETKIVEVDVSQASINVTGRVTGSSNISSSLSSTGSFGHVVATSFHGDGFAVRNTLPRSPGLLTSSAQIADVVTGSFFRGFEFSSSISGSATSTGSFGRVEGVEFFGDGSGIKTTLPRTTNILSSSAQIASNISGSFNKGFEYTGTIQGISNELVTNGDFASDSGWTLETGWAISAGKVVGTSVGYSYTARRASALTLTTGTLQTFQYSITISDYSAGSVRITVGDQYGASMPTFDANGTYTGTFTATPANQNVGFMGITTFTGKVDDFSLKQLGGDLSAVTASFGRLDGGVIRGDATDLHSTLPYDGVVSASAQLASSISGSFNKGFEFNGAIKAGEVVWTTTTEMIVGRSFLGAQGNSETALAAGGTTTTPSNTLTGKTEEWNGTSWSEVNDMIVAKDGGMAGPSTNDAYFSGGSVSWGNIEKWNGTNWTNISYPTNGAPAEGATGINPASHRGGSIGGCASDYLYLINETVYGVGGTFDEYNTATETATRCPVIPGGVHWGFSGDICTGIVAWGGYNPTELSGCTITNCWDGTTWTDTGQRVINAPNRLGWRYHRGAGDSSTSAAHIGGQTGPPSGPAWVSTCKVNSHQIWDGISWRVQADLPLPFAHIGATGTVDNTFIVGGIKGTPSAPYGQVQSGSYEHKTDLTTGSFGRLEFISASGDATGLQSSISYVTNPAFNVLTGSSQIASQISGSFTNGFDYGGLMGKARGGVFASSTALLDHHTGGSGGSMVQGTAIIAGGSYGATWPPSTTDNTQIYDGTSWTEVNNLTSGVRGNDTLALAGDSSAAVFFGCCGGGETEEWNGTNWTEVADSPDAFGTGAAGGGESSEAAIFVGYYGGRTNTWNGSSWTEANMLINVRYDASSTGTRDAHFVVGGSSPVGAPTYPYSYCSEVFNGTNWTAVADVIYKTLYAYGLGTSNDAVFVGGRDVNNHPHQAINHSQTFDGTSWAFGPNMVAKRQAESAGSKYSGPAAGGATNAAWLGGGSPGYPVYNNSNTEIFPGFVVSASFGKLEAGKLFGDASGLTDSLPYPTGVVSASGQLATNFTASTGYGSYISGAFLHGFDISGNVSGSSTTTASFGKFIATNIHGDATSISGSLSRNVGVVSGSAQIASQISGAFTSGFGFGMTALEQISGSYVGVSGSAFGYAKNDTTMSISSICGSDFEFRLADTINQIKGSEGYGRGVWSTATAMISATHGRAMAGTQNAFLSIGGYSAPTQTTTEKFNGSSWSVSAALISSAKASAGIGTQNAAGMFGGYDDYDQSEFYNGAAWSNGPNMGTSAAYRGSAGTQNAALLYGGNGPGNARKNETELYNGNVFTETANLNTNRGLASAGGTQNDAIYASGLGSGSPGGTADTEIWNGTTWSEVNNVNTTRWASTGIGTANHHIMVTGHLGGAQCNNTEEWNGTSWSETSDLISLRSYAGNAAGGLGSQGIYAGGYSSPGNAVVGTTELWNAVSNASASFHNIEVTSLSGDGSQFSASLQSQILTASSQIAADISGSFTSGFDLQGGVSASLGLYGATWSEVNPLNQARTGGAVGNKAAALASAGRDPSGAPYQSTCTELWNGVNWSVTTARSCAGAGHSIAGNTEAAVSHQSNTLCNHTEIWNGSSWAQGSTANSHQQGGNSMVGTVDAAIEAGGFNGSGGPLNNAAEWNGSVWSEATALPNNRGGGSFVGNQNDAMYNGGLVYVAPANVLEATSILYNGTNWSTGIPMLVAGRNHTGDGATSNFSVHAGGAPYTGDWPQYSTYEFNGMSWFQSADVSRSPAGARNMDIAGDPKGALAVGGYIVANTEEYSSYGGDSSGSFHHLRGTVGGEIQTNMLNVSGSTFKLPLFDDADVNYNSLEPQEGTGSMSGSVDRVADVNIFNKPGNFFFHTDYNALGFTYVSSSVYSQSLDFVNCQYESASVYTSSAGFITQSHYRYTNVIQYITGSYT